MAATAQTCHEDELQKLEDIVLKKIVQYYPCTEKEEDILRTGGKTAAFGKSTWEHKITLHRTDVDIEKSGGFYVSIATSCDVWPYSKGLLRHMQENVRPVRFVYSTDLVGSKNNIFAVYRLKDILQDKEARCILPERFIADTYPHPRLTGKKFPPFAPPPYPSPRLSDLDLTDVLHERPKNNILKFLQTGNIWYLAIEVCNQAFKYQQGDDDRPLCVTGRQQILLYVMVLLRYFPNKETDEILSRDSFWADLIKSLRKFHPDFDERKITTYFEEGVYPHQCNGPYCDCVEYYTGCRNYNMNVFGEKVPQEDDVKCLCLSYAVNRGGKFFNVKGNVMDILTSFSTKKDAAEQLTRYIQKRHLNYLINTFLRPLYVDKDPAFLLERAASLQWNSKSKDSSFGDLDGLAVAVLEETLDKKKEEETIDVTTVDDEDEEEDCEDDDETGDSDYEDWTDDSCGYKEHPAESKEYKEKYMAEMSKFGDIDQESSSVSDDTTPSAAPAKSQFGVMSLEIPDDGAAPFFVQTNAAATTSVARTKCVVCIELPNDYILNCGHQCLCAGCLDKILSSDNKRCPVCRNNIIRWMKVFNVGVEDE